MNDTLRWTALRTWLDHMGDIPDPPMDHLERYVATFEDDAGTRQWICSNLEAHLLLRCIERQILTEPTLVLLDLDQRKTLLLVREDPQIGLRGGYVTETTKLRLRPR